MKGNSPVSCCKGACPRCHACMALIVGILLLINAYWPFAGWGVLVGWIFVVAGLLKLIKPCCPHCE